MRKPRSLSEKGAICLLVAAVGLFAAATARADKIEDWKALAEFNDDYAPFLSSSSATHDDAFVEAWKAWSGEFAPFAKRFKESYGATRDDLMKSFDGMDMPEDVYVVPWNLLDLLDLDVAQRQKEIAGWLRDAGDESYRQWESYTPPNVEKQELKVKYAERALEKYRTAADLDSEGGHGEAVKKAQEALDASSKEWKKALEQFKWPGHNPDFEGPGDPEALAAEAIKLLERIAQRGDRWSKPEYDDEHVPIAACVTADQWSVSKKAPLTQEPTQYSLKLFVAFSGTKDPELAYGYHMFFYTQETGGVKPEPPFEYCNSEQYSGFRLLMSSVPKGARQAAAKATKAAGGASEAAGSRVGPNAGLFGLVFRLMLTAVLLAAGLASSADFIKARVAPLGGVCATLAAESQRVGLAALAVGAMGFVRALVLHFAPLADLAPHVVAAAIGLILFAGKATVDGAGQPALAVKLAPAAAPLRPFEPVLGKVALVLGILHLLLGGLPLL